MFGINIYKNKRAIIYGIIVALGIVFVQNLAANYSTETVALGAGFLLLVLSIEIFTSYFSANKLLNQLDLPNVELYTRQVQLVYHAVLPLSLLASIIGFVVTNNIPKFTLIYFVITFTLFTMLFINIRAYYEDKFKLEEKTHFIYDIIKIILYFTAIDGLLNFSSQHSFNFFIESGLIFCVASILTLLILIRRKHVNLYSILLILLGGMVLGYMTATLGAVTQGNNLITAFYSTLIFYIINGVLFHELEKTLKLSTLIEYLLVAVISFLIILLLT